MRSIVAPDAVAPMVTGLGAEPWSAIVTRKQILSPGIAARTSTGSSGGITSIVKPAVDGAGETVGDGVGGVGAAVAACQAGTRSRSIWATLAPEIPRISPTSRVESPTRRSSAAVRRVSSATWLRRESACRRIRPRRSTSA